MRSPQLASSLFFVLLACAPAPGPSDGGAGGGGTGGGSTGGGGGGVALGPFTSRGTSNYETQTSLAADGRGGLVAGWISFGSNNTSSIGYAVSRNAGASWTAPAYVSSPGGRLASNPVVAADGQGRFWAAWLGFRVIGDPDEHIYVARLDPGTETFAAPVLASDPGTSTATDFDKPSLTVDANDNLLLTWSDFTSSSSGVMPSITFARSVDGTHFTRSTVVADATFGNLASLCSPTELGPNAPLYLVHLAAGATLSLRVSTNQGASWQLHPVPAADVVFQDVTCAAHGADVWLAYASGMAAFSPWMDSPADAIKLIHSGNSGVSFDPAVTVSKGPAMTQYLFPRLARTGGGKLELTWYQSPTGAAVELELASSADAVSFTVAPVAAAGHFTLDRSIASWLGAYGGLALAGTRTFVTYAQNTENKAHIAFAEVTAP